MIIKLLVDGGEMKVAPAVAQKLGPLGMNIGKIVEEVNAATQGFKGMKVPVILNVNPKTKEFTIKVETPPTAELLKKEFGLEKGSGEAAKIKVANAAIEQIIKIAKIKQEGMLVNNLKKAVKNVLGSCLSLGILIESQNAKLISKRVDSGVYDDLIAKGVTKASEEKLKKLQEEFEVVKKKQEEILKAEEEAKAAEEAKAEEAKVAEAVVAAGEGREEKPVPAEAKETKEPKEKPEKLREEKKK